MQQYFHMGISTWCAAARPNYCALHTATIKEVSSIDGAVEKIKAAIAMLNELCFTSGNLKSSFGAERDKTVACYCNNGNSSWVFSFPSYQSCSVSR